MKKKLGLSKKIIYPASSPFISKKDINSVNNTLKNDWVSSSWSEVKKYQKKQNRFLW